MLLTATEMNKVGSKNMFQHFVLNSKIKKKYEFKISFSSICKNVSIPEAFTLKF